jgi:hypothetical protein
MAIGQDTLNQITGPKTKKEDLDKIESFTWQGSQDGSNQAARKMIEQRRLQAKAQQNSSRLSSQVADQANTMRNQMPGLVNERMNPYRDQAMSEALAAKQKERVMSNSRGMLYSGGSAGRQSEIESMALQNLAKKRQAVQGELSDDVEGIENAVAGQGLSQFQDERDLTLQSLENAMKRKQQQDELKSGLLGVGGKLGGAILGAGF